MGRKLVARDGERLGNLTDGHFPPADFYVRKIFAGLQQQSLWLPRRMILTKCPFRVVRDNGKNNGQRRLDRES